eukprot:m.57283 g.57283  ORF g.57283 m.57283 type:complete len:293 (-) comp11095_c0_seq1:30-908(-)
MDQNKESQFADSTNNDTAFGAKFMSSLSPSTEVTSGQGFNFGSAPSTGSISFGSPSFSLGDAPKNAQPEESEEQTNDPELPEFQPLVSLPKVEVQTGEENEEEVLSLRAKMYVWGEGNAGLQWKDRGVGPLKLLRHKETGLTRLLMRRDKTLKICGNHILSQEMNLEPKQGSDKTWVYTCHADYSDYAGEAQMKVATIALRFKDSTNAEKFRDVFNKCKARNLSIRNGTHSDSSEEEFIKLSVLLSSSQATKQAHNQDEFVRLSVLLGTAHNNADSAVCDLVEDFVKLSCLL